jgi:alanine racemase
VNLRPLVARIDTAALAHNLLLARRHAGQARVLAVIKANGYGHGLLRVADALRSADGFAVLTLDEAAALRTQGYTHPIVLLEGWFHVDELPEIARLRLRPVIHREDQAELLARTRLDNRIDVFVKLDTGMHRLGLPPQRLAPVLDKLHAAPQVGSITLMTHFACADDPGIGVAAQLAHFWAAVNSLPYGRGAGGAAEGPTPPSPWGEGLGERVYLPPPPWGEGPGERVYPITLANSAALLAYPETRGDWVRPGILLYGASPFPGQTGEALGLLPAMTLESALIAIQPVRKGESVGYGAAFVAPRDMRIGIVACGYADGYPRHAGTGTPILVEGRLTRTLGRVSMDMLAVDLTDVPQAHIGSPVTLWGAGLPVERVAEAAGTIAYELLTAVAPRVRFEAV